MKKDNLDLSVIILSFNTIDLTRECLKSVFASKLGDLSMEVIVCDNASADNTDQMVLHEFPNVKFIQNGENIGFAAGNNKGIKIAKGRNILLLNSDTEVSNTALSVMVKFMDSHPDAGAATCMLLLKDGTMDPACHRGFPSPWVALTYITKLERLFPRSKLFGEYHQGYKDLHREHTVDCISGAFFMVRREVIDDVGLLDEDYFMYAEDIDWAFRIRRKKWNIWFVPSVSTLHKKKQSGRSNILKKRRVKSEIYFHRNNWLFYKKHYASIYGPLINGIINTIYTLRLFLLETFSI